MAVINCAASENIMPLFLEFLPENGTNNNKTCKFAKPFVSAAEQ